MNTRLQLLRISTIEAQSRRAQWSHGFEEAQSGKDLLPMLENDPETASESTPELHVRLFRS